MTLSAKKRNPGQKSVHLRRQGEIPACLFGHGLDPISLRIEARELNKCLAQRPSSLDLSIEGAAKHLVSLKEIQRDPLGNHVLHVSFHALKKDVKALFVVPVRLTDSGDGKKKEGEIGQATQEISLRALPSDVPGEILVDVTNLKIGDQIRVGDIVAQYDKVDFAEEDKNKVLANCYQPRALSLETPQPVDEAKASEEEATSGGETPPEGNKEDKT